MDNPYDNYGKAPMFVQKCRCPLYCPMHGENGPIPGDMKSPAQPWVPSEAVVQETGQQISNSTGPALPVQTTALGPAPVNENGVIGNGIAQTVGWVEQSAPVTTLETYTTPASIIPVDIPDAVEQLETAGIHVSQDQENITITVNGSTITFAFDLANCLAQEVLNTRKRIELTLPETLETTLEAAKKRLGPDMAPLIDLIVKGLDNRQ